MRIKFFATIFALAIFALLPLPSHANWRDTFVRVIGPPLINRGINYLLSNRRHYQDAPQTQSTPARKAVPKPPVVSHSVPKPTATGAPSSTKLEVPPPPQTLVPPPPPGVPTGAVLGLYPPDMNTVYEPPPKPKGSVKPPPPPEALILPKVAPDFRKQAQH